jgi:hypothetical protein
MPARFWVVSEKKSIRVKGLQVIPGTRGRQMVASMARPWSALAVLVIASCMVETASAMHLVSADISWAVCDSFADPRFRTFLPIVIIPGPLCLLLWFFSDVMMPCSSAEVCASNTSGPLTVGVTVNALWLNSVTLGTGPARALSSSTVVLPKGNSVQVGLCKMA